MADTKISALTAVTSPALTDEFACNQSGTSKKVTLDTLAQFADANNFARLSSDYTLTSSTSVQKLFNTSTNGALTLPTGLFYMLCQFQITGMSATSGNGVFSVAGTATLGSQMLSGIGIDATTMVTGAAGSFAMIQAASGFTTSMAVASTGTALGVKIEGIFTVTAGGTIIPSIALTTAAAAAVKAGSVIIVNKIGAATDTTRGSWS